jgi:LuxR family maltose regulon positive regulatory protein
MTTPLLTTKLYIPPPRPNLVPRPRLIQRLDQGLKLGHRLTLVSAPAGFGKTTLITEWVCNLTREVAWLSLDEGDNDPVQFLTYLILALQQVDGSIGQAAQQMLGSSGFAKAGPSPTQSLVTSLINDVTTADVPFALVLDDYHLVTEPAVHQALEFLLSHQPPLLHLAISTRQDPPLPLHQLRARSQVTELRERDLRFSAEEAAAFLNQTMGLHLSAEAVETLETRTEGWITGLQLAALALQESPGDVLTFIDAFTGDDRYVMDYLVTEVLQRQPEAMREFLRQTAILDRLTAPLCDAVVKIKDWSLEGSKPRMAGLRSLISRPQSQTFLEYLEQANLFIVPLDNRRQWYRYHRLFAEFLHTTLDEEEQQVLHRRAARWYEEQGLMGQSIQHALAYATASQDWKDAETLIRQAAEETIHRGGILTVGGWLEALPEASVRADAELAIYQGWVLALNGELSRAGDSVQAAKECLSQAEASDSDQGKLLTLHSFIAVFGRQAYDEAIELAAEALQLLDEDQTYWRVMALWAMAESQERTRNVTEAISTLREARRTGRLLDGQLFFAPAELFLATTLQLHGQRREAVTVCEEAIEWYTDDAGRTSPVAGMIYSRLGMLHHEANQLDQAEEYLARGTALSEQLAMDSPIMYSLSFAAPTLHAQGKTDAALEALQKAHQHGTQSGLADAEWCLALEANIRLQQGDVPFVVRWAESQNLSLDDTPHYLRIEQQLVYARLLLCQGHVDDVAHWLVCLEQFLQERGLIRWLLTVRILQALAAGQAGDQSAAHEFTHQALEIAAPEDYYRAFLDEDERILALVRDVRRVAPAFVDQLLAYAEPMKAPHATEKMVAVPPVPQPLIEPLTERELEVLGLIAAGLSNREVAQELVIAVGTVKRHLNNIYGKLDVHSRTQAAARARDLGLL